MSDLIDREEALTALRDTLKTGGKSKGLRPVTFEMIWAIKSLPSAEPKKGRWIFARSFVWECSECGKSPTKGMGFTKRKDELFRYCPNCGAKMEEE